LKVSVVQVRAKRMILWERDLFIRAICGSLKISVGHISTDYGKLDYHKLIKKDKEIVFSKQDFDWFRRALLRGEKSQRNEYRKKIIFLPPCCCKHYVVAKTLVGEKTAIEITSEERKELLKVMFCDVSEKCDRLKYKSVESRLKTYREWKNTSVSVNDLANAGFYYTKLDDIVRCFMCGVFVYDWKAGDNPLAAHDMWSPFCRFVSDTNSGSGIDECGGAGGVPEELPTSYGKDWQPIVPSSGNETGDHVCVAIECTQ
jgi:hypothetical protein